MGVLGAQKNRLIETVLLSTDNICFGWRIIFSNAQLSGGLTMLLFLFSAEALTCSYPHAHYINAATEKFYEDMDEHDFDNKSDICA